MTGAHGTKCMTHSGSALKVSLLNKKMFKKPGSAFELTPASTYARNYKARNVEQPPQCTLGCDSYKVQSSHVDT